MGISTSVDVSHISVLYSFILSMRDLYVTCKFPSLEKDLDLEYFDWKYIVVPGFDKCLEPQTFGLPLQYYWSLTIRDNKPVQLHVNWKLESIGV